MVVSDEQKRANAAARSRASRARKRAARDEALAAERDSDTAKAPRTQRDALEAALAAMKWLTASDGAAVALARQLAERVDVLWFVGDEAKALAAAGKLASVLHGIGGMPTVRMAHELRSLKASAKGAGDGGDTSDEDGEVPTNVTKLQRPAKLKA